MYECMFVHLYIDIFWVQNGDIQKQHYHKWGMVINPTVGTLLFVYLSKKD